MKLAVDRVLNISRSAWRFRWTALACAWLVAIAGWTVVFTMPGRYDTQARVFIDMTSSLRPLLEGLAIAPNTGNQVEIVRRALVGRPQLERVIETTGLKQRAGSVAQHEVLVTALAEKIRISGDMQSRNYSITYSDSDPKISYSVVKSLLDAFVSQSLQANRTDSQSAQKFLLEQIQEYDRRLTESEKQLAEFKSQNVGAMPDDRGGYFERLQGEMTETDRLSSSLSVAVRRRNELRQRLLGGSPRTDGSAQIATSVDGRITESRSQLADMLLRFTAAHPDVIALNEVIATLEEQRKDEIESMRQNVDSLGSRRSDSGSLVQQNLQISLNEVEVEIASLGAQIEDRKERVRELQSSINTLPKVEAELTRLNRDYGINRAQYDALMQRLESARLSQQAERSQDVIFKIVEPPSMPLVPASPNRVLLSLAVLAAAFGAGAGLAYFLSIIRPVYFGTADLADTYMDLPVIGSIGLLRSRGVIVRERLGLLLYSSVAGALVAVLGVVLITYRRWGTLTPLLFGGDIT